MASESDGNGRVPFTISLKPEILEEFRQMCEKHGYMPSRRLEVLMKKDIEDDKNAEK